jgi:hypothetical protein
MQPKSLKILSIKLLIDYLWANLPIFLNKANVYSKNRVILSHCEYIIHFVKIAQATLQWRLF